MTHTRKILAFLLCAAIVIAVLAGCSEKQGLSTEFDMGSLYSADGQRFCIDKLTVPLGADELAETLKEYRLKYTEEVYNDEVTQWVVTAPASIEGYAASLVFNIGGDPETVTQITLLIEDGDLGQIFEEITAAATELFGEDSFEAVGGEKLLFRWNAYTEHGIVKPGEEVPSADSVQAEWGDSSTLTISLAESIPAVVVAVS